MQFLVAFLATLACACAAPRAYVPYLGSLFGHSPAPITEQPSDSGDTPDVASDKAAHSGEKEKVSFDPYDVTAPNAPYVPYTESYTYGPATITSLPNGSLSESSEVAGSKADHEAEKSADDAPSADTPAPDAPAPPADPSPN